MQRLRLPVLIIAAALVACSESQPPTQPPNATPALHDTVLVGTIIPNPNGGRDPSAIVLRKLNGTVVGLAGDQMTSLASVIDAQVEVRGQLQDLALLSVRSFVVQEVGGLPASDGVLVQNQTAYTLRLTTGGSRDVINPSTALRQHVGERVWMTGPENASPTAFGVIAVAAQR